MSHFDLNMNPDFQGHRFQILMIISINWSLNYDLGLEGESKTICPMSSSEKLCGRWYDRFKKAQGRDFLLLQMHYANISFEGYFTDIGG